MKTLTDTAIAILFVIAAITLFAEPAETSSSWLTDFILIKQLQQHRYWPSTSSAANGKAAAHNEDTPAHGE